MSDPETLPEFRRPSPHGIFSGRCLLVGANDGTVEHQVFVVAVSGQLSVSNTRSQTPAWHHPLKRR